MASDPKQSAPPETGAAASHPKGVHIFTYPKIIFIFPTMLVALICGIGMKSIGDNTLDPTKQPATAQAAHETGPHEAGQAKAGQTETAQTEAGQPLSTAKQERFTTPQNLLGVLFLTVLAFNLLIMAIDFPRFTIIAIVLLALFALFFFLWIGAYFEVDLMRSVHRIMGSIFVVANSGFYLMVALVLAVMYIIIYFTRYLDYWEIQPNEILHHHGPLSDLERFPTMNLKFDKEIPDVLEFLFLGAGRLVLHLSQERRAIVLDNVLFINSKEDALKRLMSRLEVRVTTDQEVAEP